MPVQIVMDTTGDTRHCFDNRDPESVARAEDCFNRLVSQGFTPAMRVTDGRVRKLRSFDPTVEETIFFPRLVGG